MFQRDDIIALLRKQPFQPFRIHLVNGQVYDIRHPDMAAPTVEWIHLMVPPISNPDAFERLEIVQIAHILKLEPYHYQPKSSVAA